MRRDVTPSLLVFGLTVAYGGQVLAACSVPDPSEPLKLRCVIEKAADCDQIEDFPYARKLFCTAAFSAAQEMVAEVAHTLGVNAPKNGFFYFYQSLPDSSEFPQTEIACGKTQLPGGGKEVSGAGEPLCNLVAYATSPGPDAGKGAKEEPIPHALRDFPDYFSNLYSPEKKFELKKFRTGSPFDKLVTGLGAAGYDGFKKDYHKFSTTKLYDPDHFSKDPLYTGVTGGGGGGWGGEIAVLADGGPVVQFAFGGGGGGGMNSFQPVATTLGPGKPPVIPAVSGLGAGGGGGAQFASGYRFAGQSYNGLGLGAGVGSTSLDPDAKVQYSYNDYRSTPRPPLHDFNAPIVGDYEAQLKNLAAQLKSGYGTGGTIVLRGGGGMGGGTDYLSSGGLPAGPHALSTSGGFQFNYEFARPDSNGPGLTELHTLNGVQQNIYEAIGESYQFAAAAALEACGNNYANFACMCPVEHAFVICQAAKLVGPTNVPGWLQQRHCPGDDNGSNGLSPFSAYQRHLLTAANFMADAINDGSLDSCNTDLSAYFGTQNTPVTP